MNENKVRGVLYDESYALKEWQEPHHADLPGMIESIKHIKESFNDYLTDLIKEGKVCTTKYDTVYFDDNEEEQEEIQEDRISGLIKGMTAAVSEECTRNIKRRMNYSNQIKKFKK